MNPNNENKKRISKVGEAGAGVDAEVGLQRSSTNPLLQTAHEETQMPTVAAGPGSSGSGTNVVPRQVAMEEDSNQQTTAGSYSDRKRLTGSQKRKLRRQALRANEAAGGATALQSPVAREPASNWPRFETSFCRGGVFIFVASNPEAKAWLTKTVADIRRWEGAKLKVSGVETLQKMLKATA